MSPGTFPLSTPRGWDCKHATVSCFLHVLGSNSDSCFCMRWFPDAADCWGKTYKHMKQPLLISRYSLKSHGEAGNSAERTSGLEEEMVLLALWLSEDTVTLRGHCDQRAEGWGGGSGRDASSWAPSVFSPSLIFFPSLSPFPRITSDTRAPSLPVCSGC